MKKLGKKYLISTTVLSSFLAAAAVFATSGLLMPASDGTWLEWTKVPDTAASHAVVVDDSPCNGDLDYVRETTIGERDSYNLDLSSIPNGSSMTEIQISPCAANAYPPIVGAAGEIKVFYILNGGPRVYSATKILAGTVPVQMAPSFLPISPAVSKLSTTTIEVGAELTGGRRGAEVSNLKTIIVY